MRTRHTRRSIAALIAAVLLIGGASTLIRGHEGGASPGRASTTPEADRIFASNDAVERGCALDKEILTRLWRGYVDGKTFELLFVPQHPNYPGSFGYWAHTGPWDYLQQVPLVLYGPRIEDAGRVERAVDLTDVYPTMNELLDAGLPARAGTPLREALEEGRSGTPRLIVTFVLDGVGRNVLSRWPRAWPNLAELEKKGTSYMNATLGSAPSITPATHATLGTGVYPRRHGMPSIWMRDDDGSMTTASAGRDPSDIKVPTFGDLYDKERGNRPLVGLLGWSAWHLGLLGHGKQMNGGDADHLGIFLGRGGVVGNERFYETPSYFPGKSVLEEHARALDAKDGKADGKWLGHDLLDHHVNPASVDWQLDGILRLIRREGYGRDRVPDLFAANVKIADLIGHNYSMDSPEMRAVLHSEDAALGRLVRFLDNRVGDYVLIVTADHGHTTSSTGGWPFDPVPLGDDLDRRFGFSADESIVERTTTAGFYLDHRARLEAGITGREITEFVNDYTIAQNWDEGELPDEFAGRGQEHLFSAAFMRGDFPDIMECAFGPSWRAKGALD